MSDSSSDIKPVMREFFKHNFLYSSDIDSISDDTSFMNEGIIDSTGVLELIDFIEERFGVDIENNEVISILSIISKGSFVQNCNILDGVP